MLTVKKDTYYCSPEVKVAKIITHRRLMLSSDENYMSMHEKDLGDGGFGEE